MKIGTFLPKMKKLKSIQVNVLQRLKNSLPRTHIVLLVSLLLLAGDIESNPGPKSTRTTATVSAKGSSSETVAGTVKAKDRQATLSFSPSHSTNTSSPQTPNGNPMRKSAQDTVSMSQVTATPPTQENQPCSDDPFTSADIMRAISSLSSKFDHFSTKIGSLEENLRSVADQTSGLQDQIANIAEENARILAENASLKDTIGRLEAKIDATESQSRRCNLIFHGLPKSVENETWDDCEEMVQRTVREKMNLSEDIDIERAHRLRTSAQPQPIIVKFSSYKAKTKILNAKKSLQGSNIHISEDFTPRVRNIRKSLNSFLKDARQQGQRASLVYDHLLIDGQRYDLDESNNTIKPAGKKKDNPITQQESA